MCRSELLFRDTESVANLPQHFLVLSFLLLTHLLHDALVLKPVVALVGLTTTVNGVLDVDLLALLCDLCLAVDQAEEVISVECITVILVVSTHDVRQSLLL